jgi:hypothetical protein
VVATLETNNVCIAEDFAEEVDRSYGQYVNHRVSKGVTEQCEDLLAPKPNVFRKVESNARFSTSSSIIAKSRWSIDSSRRDPEIGHSTSRRIQSSRMVT